MVLIISASTKRAIAAKSVKERKPAKSVLDDLAVFASRFNIAPLDAYVLPGLFGSAAAKAGLALQTLVAEAKDCHHFDNSVPIGHSGLLCCCERSDLVKRIRQ